ncbi:hypothetical protein B0O99DRAFT_679450, partial [Bisporella sp. PMI_857]
MRQSRYDEDYPLINNESDSASDSDTDSLFDSSDNEVDTASDTDSEASLEEIDSDTNNDDLFDDEVRHPPEYYLAASANLDVGRLRQKRYSPKTQDRLDWVKDHHDRYCTFIKKHPVQCFQEVSANFLYGFLCWVCDQRRGKRGRRRPGIKHTSSLQTFWKWYLIVYRLETGMKIDGLVQVQGQNVLKVVATEKELDNTKRESATMYVEDLAEYARVLLTTREMTFQLGWLRIQLILFCQLAGITGNRPKALVQLRYRHLKLTLIRDHSNSRPRLFIELTAEFTKGFLGMKDANEFKIPEIIYDPTLVLSPYTFLLGMLFKVQAFESPSIVSPEKLYSLNVLKRMNEQQLPLKDALSDDFIFCQAIQTAYGVCLAPHLQLFSDSVRYRMKIGGQITGFAQVTKPYVFRDGAAKELNESPDVSDSFQNFILQHSSIDTFLKHYLDWNINVDVQNIYRGQAPQRELMRFACSMSRSIDPRRPRKLTPEQSASVNELPCIVKLKCRITKLSGIREDPVGEAKYQKARRRLQSEKQRQRRLLLVDLVERFKKEQPVIDSERQLAGKVVDEDTRDALAQSDRVTPEHLLLIDAILTLPETSLENEYQRRIAAVNAITAYCGVEEGPASRRIQRGRPVKDESPPVLKTEEPDTLSQAIRSIKSEKRPTKCFVCLGNRSLTLRERVASYATSGSLSRHFLRKHTTLQTLVQYFFVSFHWQET